MPIIPPETILQAKQMDLLTYLQNYEPGELIKLSGDAYCTKQHDSLKISNGKWYWFSRGIGGSSALDYLIKVQGYSFANAVKTIAGRAAGRLPFYYAHETTQERRLLLANHSSCFCHAE